MAVKTNLAERRSSERVDCDIETPGYGHIRNLSESGAYFESRDDYSMHQIVSITFRMPTNQKKVSILGKIKRRVTTSVSSVHGYGIEFIEEHHESENPKVLNDFIRRRQAQLAEQNPEDLAPPVRIPSVALRRRKKVKMREVVVTGIGLITSIGKDKDEYWKNLIAGKVGIEKVDDPFIDGHQYPLAAISDFSLDSYQDPVHYMRLRKLNDARRKCFIGREVDLQLAAISLALKDSALKYNRADNDFGVVLGFETCGFTATEESYRDLVRIARDSKKLSENEVITEFFKDQMLSYMNSCSFSNMYYVTSAFGLHGPSITLNTASASGMSAFHDAYTRIRIGDTNVMVAGAVEDLADSSLRYHFFKRVKVYNDDGKVLPWDKNRNGVVAGEAGVAVILEEKESAIRRGATIYAEVTESTMSQDGFSIFAPDANARYLIRSYEDTLHKGNTQSNEIDLVLPHSTGTRLNDQIQTDAIRATFGHHEPYVTSFTPQIGHPLGASGLIRIATGALAIKEQTVPPTVATKDIDPNCAVKLTKKPVKKKIRNALCSAISYGGTNVATILKAV